MTKITRAAWLANMIALVKLNGNGEITGQLLQDLLEDLGDSTAFLDSDIGYLGLRQHRADVPYLAGMSVIKDGYIYVAAFDNQGVFNPVNWTKVGVSLDFGYADYDNGTSYVLNNKVTYQFRLFKCLSPVQGVPPINEDDGSVNSNWSEISANVTAVISAWAAGAYRNNSVVRRNDKFYYLDEPDGFISSDMDAEIIAGSWVQVANDFDYLVIRSNPSGYRFRFDVDDEGALNPNGIYLP